MIEKSAVAVGADALAEAKAYLRLDGTGDDPAVSALIAGAYDAAEAFLGSAPIVRGYVETIAPTAEWRSLGAEPVRAITSVLALALDGSTSSIAAGAYEIDIDSEGRGSVRFVAPLSQKRVIIGFTAGLETGWATIDPGIRQGIVRLVAHGFAYRERADALGPPAAVTALWQPYRRMRLSVSTSSKQA